MKRSSALVRRTPLRPRKNKPAVRVGKVSGKVRLSGLALERLRDRVYLRDKGTCQHCQQWMPKFGSVFNRAHLAHIQGRGAGGSDTEANTRLLCFSCHIGLEHTKGMEL